MLKITLRLRREVTMTTRWLPVQLATESRPKQRTYFVGTTRKGNETRIVNTKDHFTEEPRCPPALPLTQLMNPEQFLKSIYLGDRACKAVMIETGRRRVAVQVDVISRLKPGTEAWDYYTEADIKDGWLVFTEVRSVSFEPPGPLPNDLINDVSVKPVHSSGAEPLWLFEASIGSVNESGNSTEVHVRIEAGGAHLEDPAKPGTEIIS